MTKVEAIKKILEDNGGIATWEIIYNEIEKYYPKAKASREWQAGIRGVLYREIKNNKSFKKIEEGTFAILDYDEKSLILPEIDTEDKETTKEIIVSSTLAQKNINRLNIHSGQQFSDLLIIGREEYLEYHRNKIFLHT